MTQHPKEPRELDHWMYAQTREDEVERVAHAIWQALEGDTHDGSEDIDSIGMKLSSPDTRNRIYRIAQAAIAATPPQWQPIETAWRARDRLIIVSDGNSVWAGAEWIQREESWIGCGGITPTHWIEPQNIPLPAAPQAPALPETGVGQTIDSNEQEGARA